MVSSGGEYSGHGTAGGPERSTRTTSRDRRPSRSEGARRIVGHHDVSAFSAEHPTFIWPSRVTWMIGGRSEFRDRVGRSLESRGRGPLEDVAPFDPVELEARLHYSAFRIRWLQRRRRAARLASWRLARVSVGRGVAVLGRAWTGERGLIRRCRSGEVLAELAAEAAEDFGVLRLFL